MIKSNHIIPKCLTAVLSCVLFLCQTTEVKADMLPVQIEHQQYENWCVPAVLAAVFNRYLKYPGLDTTSVGGKGQCAIANQSRSHTGRDCCIHPASCNYVTPTISSIKSLLEGSPYGLKATVYTRTLTDAAIATQVNTYQRPVLAGLKNIDPLSKRHELHMVLIVGLDTSGRNATLMDPWLKNDNYILVSLEELRNGAVGHEYLKDYKWIETITLNSNPPADVKLRYTYMSEKHFFESPGNMTIGPDYTIRKNSDAEYIASKGKTITLKNGFVAEKGSFIVVSTDGAFQEDPGMGSQFKIKPWVIEWWPWPGPWGIWGTTEVP